MTLDEKLKQLDKAKEMIDKAIENLYTAGVYYEKAIPDESSRFYKYRWELENVKERIKQVATKLRVSEEKSEKDA